MEFFDVLFDRFHIEARKPLADVPPRETAQLFADWLVEKVVAGPQEDELVLGHRLVAGDWFGQQQRQAEELLHHLAAKGAFSEIQAQRRQRTRLFREVGLKMPLGPRRVRSRRRRPEL